MTISPLCTVRTEVSLAPESVLAYSDVVWFVNAAWWEQKEHWSGPISGVWSWICLKLTLKPQTSLFCSLDSSLPI